jgi:D-glycero-alpha-D-manno-heptose 1-phosphate guanylyltransferase
MEVIILAGGLGTRLRSDVKDVPKSMAPIAGKPFMWYLLKYLSKYDQISRVILSVGYLREVIFEWIDQVKDTFPFEFDYAVEEQPLGTGGAIKLAFNKAKDEHVFVLNGDTFFDVDLMELYTTHHTNKKNITMALKLMTKFERYGTVCIDNNGEAGTILSFNEKKYCEEGLINGGVYIINKDPHIFEGLGDKFSFETAVLEPQCYNHQLFGTVQDGYFIDIGIPEDFHKANQELPSLFI